MEALSQVCDPYLLKNKRLNGTTNPREYIKLLKEMAVPFDYMALRCGWRLDPEWCSELFTEVITEEGICYTFNMLDS